MRIILSLCGLSLLAACSGGSDSGNVAPPPTPTLAVTLDRTAQTQVASEADSQTSFSFVATYSGSSDRPVLPKLNFDTTVLAQDGDIVRSGNSFQVKLKSLDKLSATTRSGDVTFRLCLDDGCAQVYPGSTQTFRYTLDVKLLDWVTFQRTASHTAYINASFDPARFSKAWDKSFSRATTLKPVATKGEQVFVTWAGATGQGVVALDSATGADRWTYDFGPIYSTSGPSVTGDQLQVVTMSSSSDNRIVTIDTGNGQFVRNMLFASQWSIFAQPTAMDRELFLASGYYGNTVYSYDLDNGTKRWEVQGSAGKVWDGATVAADSQYVYYYSGALDVFRRSDGVRVKSIDDPHWVWNGYTYAGGPILGSRANAITYSGTGMGVYDISFPLVSFDIAGERVAWRTAGTYSTAPALGNGLLFAASNPSGRLDAIGEDDGVIRWSWPLPAGETFVGNVLVTNNLVFFSTNAKVYAVSLTAPYATVWSAATPGHLALTQDAKLVVTPVSGTGAVITAYALR
ncbi:MAG: hypothetical protein CVT77_08445 [Alphaproteobacteria bacterium HGW-Alphaproteobacteria-16]|nr:MAG: hypothetical protein CVT77_08445 [Alphaproteobacteria bacterium HGW-Alphaproteobacteria-16]